MLRARTVVTPDGARPAAVLVAGGVIVGVEAFDVVVPAARDVRYDDDVALLPGLVDTHVHLQEPGPHAWEGFATGTAAAAAGGITTLVDMPLDAIPVTTTVEALQAKRSAAHSAVHVDVGFWGGAVPGNLDRLDTLWTAGVRGFKAYLVDAGLDGFAPLTPAELVTALAATARLGAVLAVHAEDPAHLPGEPPPTPTTDYRAFLAGQPAAAEESAVEAVVRAAAVTGGRAHIVHVASAGAAALVADAQADGVPVTAETCPHHLALAAEEVPDGATAFKVTPPLRDAANRDRLWRHLGAGTLGLVVSDHSPFGLAEDGTDLKHEADGDFCRAAGGIVGLQLSLPVTWTAARARGFALVDVARWMAAAPAALLGLGRPGHGKGSIAVGNDADLCVLAPDETFVVDPARLRHRLPTTPYAGRTLSGVVRQTWLRGDLVDHATVRGRLL